MDTGPPTPAVRITPQLMFGLVIILIGVVFTLDSLDIVAADRFLRYWPAALVLVGSVVVWQSLRGRRLRGNEANDAVVNAIAILSGVRRRSRSRSFRGGELTAFVGGCEIDLRDAEIHGEAVFDVFAMWGGIEIRVPESWSVIGQMTPIMGGFEDSTRATGDARNHTLIVRGLVVMGGVEVKN